jgi:ATP-binding cassette, subfamily B, multidrug efflux pump
MAYVVPRFARAAEQVQASRSALTGSLVDSYANIDTIKLYAPSMGEDRESRIRLASLRRSLFGLLRLEVTMNSAMAYLGSLLLVGITGYAIVLWAGGAAPLGIVAVALALSFQITGMAEWLMDAVSNMFESIGALRQSLATVSVPPAIVDAPNARALVVTGGAIRIADVSHHYGKGKGALDHVSLDIAAGEKVGLVGRSGAGKSTLVSLILRFFDAEGGRIEIDGQDITAVTQASLRKSIALVPQDAALLNRSVLDNIAFGRGDISEFAIDAAVAKAAADRFVGGLRDYQGRVGLAAHVGERGVVLSGGQRQRIALARAILKDAPILVLDEATSALDSEVEAVIQETLDTVMAGKTVIAIAHRLSTIARMDRIVVLDGGRIVEHGTHAELLKMGGLYGLLWARQSGGFIGTGE